MKTQILATACAALIGAFVLTTAQAQTPQQRMKECATEWSGLKAAKQTEGKTYRDFQKECLAKGASAQPPAGQAATPAAAPPATAKQPPAAKAPAAKAAATQSLGAGQFKSEAEAKGHCPADTVVWVNLNSKIYHYSGNRSYGTTKSGAYMCEKETASSGFRASKTEKKGT
jgi:psiF repeat